MEPFQRVVVISGASFSVVPLATLKAHLRIDGTAEDAALQLYLDTATNLLEQRYGLHLRTGSVAVWMDQPPRPDGLSYAQQRTWWRWQRVNLLPRPITALSSVEAIAEDGTATTIAAGDAWLAPGGPRERRILALRPAAVWLDPGRQLAALKATVAVGWSDGQIPPELRQGVLLLAAWLYEHRGDCDCGAPTVTAWAGVDTVCATWRTWSL